MIVLAGDITRIVDRECPSQQCLFLRGSPLVSGGDGNVVQIRSDGEAIRSFQLLPNRQRCSKRNLGFRRPPHHSKRLALAQKPVREVRAFRTVDSLGNPQRRFIDGQVLRIEALAVIKCSECAHQHQMRFHAAAVRLSQGNHCLRMWAQPVPHRPGEWVFRCLVGCKMHQRGAGPFNPPRNPVPGNLVVQHQPFQSVNGECIPASLNERIAHQFRDGISYGPLGNRLTRLVAPQLHQRLQLHRAICKHCGRNGCGGQKAGGA